MIQFNNNTPVQVIDQEGNVYVPQKAMNTEYKTWTLSEAAYWASMMWQQEGCKDSEFLEYVIMAYIATLVEKENIDSKPSMEQVLQMSVHSIQRDVELLLYQPQILEIYNKTKLFTLETVKGFAQVVKENERLLIDGVIHSFYQQYIVAKTYISEDDKNTVAEMQFEIASLKFDWQPVIQKVLSESGAKGVKTISIYRNYEYDKYYGTKEMVNEGSIYYYLSDEGIPYMHWDKKRFLEMRAEEGEESYESVIDERLAQGSTLGEEFDTYYCRTICNLKFKLLLEEELDLDTMEVAGTKDADANVLGLLGDIIKENYGEYITSVTTSLKTVNTGVILNVVLESPIADFNSCCIKLKFGSKAEYNKSSYIDMFNMFKNKFNVLTKQYEMV